IGTFIPTLATLVTIPHYHFVAVILVVVAKLIYQLIDCIRMLNKKAVWDNVIITPHLANPHTGKSTEIKTHINWTLMVDINIHSTVWIAFQVRQFLKVELKRIKEIMVVREIIEMPFTQIGIEEISYVPDPLPKHLNVVPGRSHGSFPVQDCFLSKDLHIVPAAPLYIEKLLWLSFGLFLYLK